MKSLVCAVKLDKLRENTPTSDEIREAAKSRVPVEFGYQMSIPDSKKFEFFPAGVMPIVITRFVEVCPGAVFIEGCFYRRAGEKPFVVTGLFHDNPEIPDLFELCMNNPPAEMLERLGRTEQKSA